MAKNYIYCDKNKATLKKCLQAIDKIPIKKYSRSAEDKAFWDKYTKYLKTYKWKQRRAKALRIGGFKCAYCKSTKRLQVHHLNYKNVFNEKPEDLIVLCTICHDSEHKKYQQKRQQGAKV